MTLRERLAQAESALADTLSAYYRVVGERDALSQQVADLTRNGVSIHKAVDAAVASFRAENESLQAQLEEAEARGVRAGSAEAMDTISPSLRNLPDSERESLASIRARAIGKLRLERARRTFTPT